MSSHHVVKEDQEPALLLLDPDAIPFEKIQELLEWSPLVIVSYPALEKVLAWGIKIDVLLASQDDDTTQVSLDQAPLQIIHSTGNLPVFMSTCKFLAARRQADLNVITHDATSLFVSAVSFSSQIDVVLFTGNTRWHLVKNGTYSKWLPAQSIVKMFINQGIEEKVVAETGVVKIDRPVSFWIGEEY